MQVNVDATDAPDVLTLDARNGVRLTCGVAALTAVTDREYVLGTDDEEIVRLGLQHLVWRPWMLAAWRRAGVTRGTRVLDISAGQGIATADLADASGPAWRGHVGCWARE